MNSNNNLPKDEHSFTLTGRKQMLILGVLSVLSFDESNVVLVTSCGEMEIDGNSLVVDSLDVQKGVVSVAGEVCGINYLNDKPKRKRRLKGSL